MSHPNDTKKSENLARWNIAQHVYYTALRHEISIQQSATNFVAKVNTGSATEPLNEAVKVALPDGTPLNTSCIVDWVKKFSSKLALHEDSNAEKSTKRPADKRAIAVARKEVIEFILLARKRHDSSLRQAILAFCERLKFRRLPPHIIEAVGNARAASSKTKTITISHRTLFSWIARYETANHNARALEPIPTKLAKSPYANDNDPQS